MNADPLPEFFDGRRHDKPVIESTDDRTKGRPNELKEKLDHENDGKAQDTDVEEREPAARGPSVPQKTQVEKHECKERREDRGEKEAETRKSFDGRHFCEPGD